MERTADISRGRCCTEWNSRLNKVLSFGEFSPKMGQDSSLSFYRTDWILQVWQVLPHLSKILSFGLFTLKMCSNEWKICTRLSEFASQRQQCKDIARNLARATILSVLRKSDILHETMSYSIDFLLWWCLISPLTHSEIRSSPLKSWIFDYFILYVIRLASIPSWRNY
jgi:hypothetical protein